MGVGREEAVLEETTVMSSSSSSYDEIDEVHNGLVGNGVELYEKTRFNEFSVVTTAAPNRQADGYIVLCIALRQNL